MNQEEEILHRLKNMFMLAVFEECRQRDIPQIWDDICLKMRSIERLLFEGKIITQRSENRIHFPPKTGG